MNSRSLSLLTSSLLQISMLNGLPLFSILSLLTPNLFPRFATWYLSYLNSSLVKVLEFHVWLPTFMLLLALVLMIEFALMCVFTLAWLMTYVVGAYAFVIRAWNSSIDINLVKNSRVMLTISIILTKWLIKYNQET